MALNISFNIASTILNIAGNLHKAMYKPSVNKRVPDVTKSNKEVVKSDHGNSLNTTKPAQGYAVVDRNTGEILKYGETTRGLKRYSQKWLNEVNGEMKFMAYGTKAEMHKWQNQKIWEYFFSHNGQKPPENKSFY